MMIHIQTPVSNEITGRVQEIEYDYQAEEWAKNFATILQENNALITLVDDEGERAVWEKTGMVVVLKSRSLRFTGKWQVGISFKGFSNKDIKEEML